jgi:hypothetical protein
MEKDSEVNFKLSKFKKRILLVLLLTVATLVYWLKGQIGINLFDSLSISAYFPFKYLKSNIISSPEPGIIFAENFNTKSMFKNWSELWMREAGTVTKHFSEDGLDNSRCLLIKSSSKGSWTYSHSKLIEVKKRDIFYYEGFVHLTGKSLSAFINVAAFDQNKNVIDWNFFREKVDRSGVWAGVERHFTIDDDDIKYITFRLAGVGNGEYRFDNITFRKIQ